MQPAQLKPMADKTHSSHFEEPKKVDNQSSFQPSLIQSSKLSTSSLFSSLTNRLSKNLIVPPSIWLVGMVMCLINISFVVVFSLSPLYLSKTMGMNTFWITMMEHIVEGLSYVMKLLSGIISDYFRRRKPLMLLGYFFTVISKPILAISVGPYMVFCARLLERFGNGIQSTPRDAMVGDIAPAAHRARSLGLMRSLGVAGSCLGGVLGFFAMGWTNGDFQQVFWIACIPAFVAFCLLAVFIKDPKTHVDVDGKIVQVKKDRRPIKLNDIKLLGFRYWILMIIVVIFMMARFSETLMVLYTHNSFGLEQALVPLIMTLYNFTYSVSSYASGLIADKFGRKAVLMVGIGALIASDYLLFTGSNLTAIFIGIFIWGIQMGTTLNSFMSLITDYVPEDLRGTGFGMFHLISSVGSLMAGLAAGSISHYYGVEFVFCASMIMGILALIASFILLPSQKKTIIAS